jgi:hypothetical protein
VEIRPGDANDATPSTTCPPLIRSGIIVLLADDKSSHRRHHPWPDCYGLYPICCDGLVGVGTPGFPVSNVSYNTRAIRARLYLRPARIHLRPWLLAVLARLRPRLFRVPLFVRCLARPALAHRLLLLRDQLPLALLPLLQLRPPRTRSSLPPPLTLRSMGRAYTWMRTRSRKALRGGAERVFVSLRQQLLQLRR